MKYLSPFLLFACIATLVFFVSCQEEDAPIANESPTMANQTFEVEEGAEAGTVVGTIQASDADGDDLTFTMLAGNTNSVFALAASTGELTVAVSSELVAATNPTYSLTVQVTDGTAVASATITVNVTSDITPNPDNSPPEIEDQELEIEENSSQDTLVGVIEASDDDDDELTFTIVSGNDDDAFYLDGDELLVENSAALDFETTSSFTLTIEVSDGVDEAQAEVTVVILDVEPEYFSTAQEVLDGVEEAYERFNSLIEYSYLFDAIYANTISSPSTDWDEVYNHTLTPSNEKVLQLWEDCYDLIFLANNIALSSGLVSGSEDELYGQANVFRAYAYYQLISWFDEIPLPFDDLSPGQALWSVRQEALDYSEVLLEEAIAILSSDWSLDANGNYIVKGDLAKALIPRLHFIEEFPDYAAIAVNAEDIYFDGSYSLSISTDDFQDGDPEIIWGFDKSTGTDFSTLFDKGDFVPTIRLTELLLALTEAQVNLGDIASAWNVVVSITDRASLPPPAEEADAILDEVYDAYRREMTFEGIDFSILKRFGMAETELGIEEFRLLLPYPQVVLDSDVNAPGQRAGY